MLQVSTQHIYSSPGGVTVTQLSQSGVLAEADARRLQRREGELELGRRARFARAHHDDGVAGQDFLDGAEALHGEGWRGACF